MKVSYYTIDDLRLGHDPKGVTGWRMNHYLRLDWAREKLEELRNPTQEQNSGPTMGGMTME